MNHSRCYRKQSFPILVADSESIVGREYVDMTGPEAILSVENITHVHHVYKPVWTPSLGVYLSVTHKAGNNFD